MKTRTKLGLRRAMLSRPQDHPDRVKQVVKLLVTVVKRNAADMDAGADLPRIATMFITMLMRSNST